MQQVYILNDDKERVLPITHTDAVRDSSGNTVTSILGSIEDDIEELKSQTGIEDKPYNPEEYSGLGKAYLTKNMVEGVNVLTQDMFYKDGDGGRVPNTNTVFVIQYDYDLSGATITIPSDSVLYFDGGSLKNGTVNLNDAKIMPSYEYLFASSNAVSVNGTPAAGTQRFADNRPSWWTGTEWVDGEGVNLDTAIINV